MALHRPFRSGFFCQNDLLLLHRVSSRRPRFPREFQNLLARINASTAKRQGTVSPHCTSTYMPVTGEPVQQSLLNFEAAIERPRLPILLFGIDMTGYADLLRRNPRGPLTDADVHRAALESVATRNLLRR